MSTRRYTISLLLIVAVGMAGRLFHFNLATNSDEQHYIVFARQLSGPVPVPILRTFTTRIVWGWTLNLWGRLCALNLQWTAVLMFLFAAASIVLVAMIAKRVFGPAAALVAAAIQATYFINLRYDIMATSDSMAVPITLLSTLLLLDFLKSGRTVRLVFAGALIGVLIGIKDYYAMISIPFSICLLLRPQPAPPFASRIGHVAVLGISATTVASLVLLLNYLCLGDALHQFRGISSLLPDADSKSSGAAWFIAVVGSRFKYFFYMLAENGITGGIVLLVGAVYLGSLARARLDCRLLFMIPVLFFAFLSLMFLSLRPLNFLPQEPRYLIVLAPFLAVGAAGAIVATWARIADDPVLRRCFAVLLMLNAALNLWLPNYRNTTVPVATAVRNGLAGSKSAGAAALVLPWYYRWSAPDGPIFRGLDVRYADPWPDSFDRVLRAAPKGGFDYTYGQIDAILKDPLPVAFYVPMDKDNDAEIKRLPKAGFRRIDLAGSTSSLRNWLEFFGLVKGDTPCGWLYVRDKNGPNESR
jgi:Dolichyl-phosphate-mannose-protein mannosyltransferase